MSSYELVYIVNPDVLEDGLTSVVDKIGDFIATAGGSVTEVNQWGKKKLSYPIKKYTEGHYVLTRLEMEPGAVGELDTTLRSSGDIVRHLLVKV